MLRHSVLWVLRDTTTPDEQAQMLRGLAYLRMECGSVRAGDCGRDLFGGSSVLKDVKPWLRLPRWRRGAAGPPFNYDVALHDAREERRKRAIDAVDDLRSVDGVTGIAVGHNVGKLMSDFDWILDVRWLIGTRRRPFFKAIDMPVR